MAGLLTKLANEHAPTFVVGAACSCAITAWLLLLLLERARVAGPAERIRWIGAIALVGGLGVWTTHFIAMLGFRPDVLFEYHAGITAISALIGVAFIGCPIAATALTDRRAVRAICGAVAGCGVAAMHFTGMAALQGCLVSHSSGMQLLCAGVGAILFGTALSIRDKGRHRIAVTLLIVAAVCGTHFLAMADLSIAASADAPFLGIGTVTLGSVVATVALCLFVMATGSAVASAKLDAQTRHGALLSAALTNMSNGLLLIGADGRITLLNDRLLKLFGIDGRQAAVGMKWQDYISNLGSCLGWNAARTRRVIENHAIWFTRSETTYLEHALEDGRVISVACRAMDGGGAVITYDDITRERKAQKAMERLALVDFLTGLANRRAFQGELESALESEEATTLLLVDLDRFKTINDTLGHVVGDRLLVEVGGRIGAACRNGEFVARLGGDEFALVCRGADDMQADALAARIASDLAEPFAILGHTIVIGGSVGVASTGDATDAAMLVQHADLALFRAKADGRGQKHRYEAGMQEAATERRRIEADLSHALERGEFALHYQPLYRLSDRRVVGFEALIRWTQPERGPVSPARFIPVAEETGAIREIGEWVLMEACREAATWPLDVHVAVNVSPVQLKNETFPLRVAKILAACGLCPSRLEIELTETALVEDGQQIAAGLSALRNLGIRVAMDDFGTGYSSFAHLCDFDLDRIKIDRTFVQAAPESPSALAVLKAVIQMACDLGVGTTGEGVETEEQLALLERLGCDAAQGYLIGRPMDRNAVTTLLGRAAPMPARVGTP